MFLEELMIDFDDFLTMCGDGNPTDEESTEEEQEEDGAENKTLGESVLLLQDSDVLTSKKELDGLNSKLIEIRRYIENEE